MTGPGLIPGSFHSGYVPLLPKPALNATHKGHQEYLAHRAQHLYPGVYQRGGERETGIEKGSAPFGRREGRDLAMQHSSHNQTPGYTYLSL